MRTECSEAISSYIRAAVVANNILLRAWAPVQLIRPSRSSAAAAPEAAPEEVRAR